MQEVLNVFNSSMPVGYVVAAAIAMFVAWKAGVSAFNGVKGAIANFAPGSLAAALMFITGIGGIGVGVGDLVSRSDSTPVAEQEAVEVGWLSNDEILSLRDADDDNLRVLLQFVKEQSERQREFFVERNSATQEAKEPTLVPTSAEALANVDFTLLGEDAPEPIKDTSLTENVVLDKPQLPIQGAIGLIGACVAILICGVITFIRQAA